ncbi:hypothetical protein [Azospirillum canadense]|uniref:hypothetical protein n=1 Tax=Azospirillum canadense TaxID=403962 RepID=UPI002227D537|nr:hypothetical protein [Azospirillum canadense]MCW2236007.1 hypothetical protein [Azospirillum canadense]
MPLPPSAPPSALPSESRPESHPENRRARRASAAFLLLAPLLYGLLGLALGMDANWDLRNYHWYNAYALLTGRLGRDMLAAQMPSFYNPLLDVPFFLLANHLPAPAAGFVWSALQGLNLSLLFLIARATLRVGTGGGSGGQRVAIAAGLAVMGGLGGGTLGLLGTTFHDNMVSLGVLGALAVVLCGLPRLTGGPARGAFLRVAGAGLMAGAAMGLKNPSVIYAVGLCLGFLVLPARPWRRLWLSFFFGIGVLGGLALFGGFWMAHLWHDYGNPVFPHMNHIFNSPFAAISDYVNVGFFPASTLERILFPFFFTFAPLKVGEVAFLDLRILVLFVLIPVAAALALLGKGFRLRFDAAAIADIAATRYLLTAMAVMYALWVVMFCIYRYLVPLEILAPLAIVMAAGLLPVPRRGAVVVAAALLLLVQATVRPADWGRVAWSDHWVEADVPPIGDSDHTMVLMGGYWAISHVIPAFPPRIPFVRIQSNFLQPDSVGNGYLALLKDKVGAHHGRFLMLSTIPDTAGAAKAALLLGLRVDQGACRVIPNNLGEPLNLCSVERVPMD